MTITEQIAALCDDAERHDKAATPGPWATLPTGTPHKGHVVVEEQSERGREDVAHAYCGAYDGHGARNGELIASYRTLAPVLAARLRVMMELVPLLDDIRNAADAPMECGFDVDPADVREMEANLKDATRAIANAWDRLRAKLEGM